MSNEPESARSLPAAASEGSRASRLPGMRSTRVSHTGGDVAKATCRKHGGHAEAIEVNFDAHALELAFERTQEGRSAPTFAKYPRDPTFAKGKPIK